MDAYPFRITRDADFEMKDDGSDLLTNIEELIELRHWGAVVRLEIDQRTPDRIRDILMRNLDLAPYQVYHLDGAPRLRRPVGADAGSTGRS